MPDPPPQLLTPASPPPVTVLVDRCVRFVDDLEEIIEETGGVPLDLSLKSVLNDLPPCTSKQEMENQRQRAMWEEITRHRAEVQEPAFAILRERKASPRPGMMRKEPVTFSCADAVYYRKVLDGIDPRLPQLTGGGVVNSFTIGISWPPGDHLRNYPTAGFITSCHDDLFALSFGTGAKCYLVLNTWANSVAIIPPVPTRCIAAASPCPTGPGVAVLRHNMYGDYVLAELYLHEPSRSNIASNKATLFLWWSPRSGPLADQWMQKEVVLPLPADEDTTPPTYSFRAHMVFAVSTTSLCWVDLGRGILVCDRIDMLAAGTADDVLVFRFIPFPKECATKPDLLPLWRPEDYRTMFCLDPETIMFVCVDGYNQGHPPGKTMLTTWILKLPLTDNWSWDKDPALSLCVGSLLPISKDDRKLLTPGCPVINIGTHGHVFTHLRAFSVYKHEHRQEHRQWEVTGLHLFTIDLCCEKASEWSPLSRVFPFSQIFAVSICNLGQTTEWESLQQSRPSLESPSREEVVDEDDMVDEDDSWERKLLGIAEDDYLSRHAILRQIVGAYDDYLDRRAVPCQEGIRVSTPDKEMDGASKGGSKASKGGSKIPVGASKGGSKIPVGLQCALDYPEN
ncbi:hypothetical protein BAE44_0008009 [Dichanthelium oligosanthes]|uniref:DUF1618 domain-containing protein n=1 Tax=Dichanthelium oligosanthes TaxID=888268 RepID=A0A1E5W0P7_9POAL|nr:hypothetical protein BAE44_0008009 [Dichanthelium oligosanthes]